jgi:hypothetical protein
MAYHFILLAHASLAVSLIGITAIFARKMPLLLPAGKGFSWRDFWSSKISFLQALPKKTGGFLQGTTKRKSLLKKDYWDKLLKKK